MKSELTQIFNFQLCALLKKNTLDVNSKNRHQLLYSWSKLINQNKDEDYVRRTSTKNSETLLQVFSAAVKLNLIEMAIEWHNRGCQIHPLLHTVKYGGRHISPSQPIVSNNDGS